MQKYKLTLYPLTIIRDESYIGMNKKVLEMNTACIYCKSQNACLDDHAFRPAYPY